MTELNLDEDSELFAYACELYGYQINGGVFCDEIIVDNSRIFSSLPSSITTIYRDIDLLDTFQGEAFDSERFIMRINRDGEIELYISSDHDNIPKINAGLTKGETIREIMRRIEMRNFDKSRIVTANVFNSKNPKSMIHG